MSCIKKVALLTIVFFHTFNCSFASSATNSAMSQYPGFATIFGDSNVQLTLIDKTQLPKPLDFLLTQPLMTLGLEKYYQREGMVKVIYTQKNESKNTYSRGILMLMDRDKKRNKVEIAQRKQEAVVVELALITMNFKALTQPVITGVLHSNVPFGKLLVANNLKTVSSERAYFWIRCNAKLAKLVHCKIDSKLYGRMNTLNRADNTQWLAKVVEILPAVKCSDKECYPV